MFVVCWSVKGGAGVTVVTAALGLLAARVAPTTLVDLAGDLPAALGMPDPPGPGVIEWLAAPTAPADALPTLATPIADGLRIVHHGGRDGGRGGDRGGGRAGGRGGGAGVRSGDVTLDEHDWQRVSDACLRVAETSTVIVDAGPCAPPDVVHRRADWSLIVVRACYLSLRRASRSGGDANGVVLVVEPGRALAASDVERALSAPVVAEVPWDPAVARSVDAGMLACRLPASLVRSLRSIATTEVQR